MAIGDRIKFFRKLRGLTQKELGVMAGLNGKTADIRISQYESGQRTPKEDLLNRFAYILGVLPETLNVTNLESYTDVMQILFALEDLYGLKIGREGYDYVIRLNKKHKEYPVMREMFKAWYDEASLHYMARHLCGYVFPLTNSTLYPSLADPPLLVVHDILASDISVHFLPCGSVTVYLS